MGKRIQLWQIVLLMPDGTEKTVLAEDEGGGMEAQIDVGMANPGAVLKSQRRVTRMALIDPSLAYTDMSEDGLKSLWKAYYPGGSGPLGAMRTICALIESLAHVRGFKVEEWKNEVR